MLALSLRPRRRFRMHNRFLPLLVVAVVLSAIVAVAQTTNALPSEVVAANRELDHQLLEGHRLLDTDKVMGLFTSSPEVFFISPGRADLFKGRDQVRESWKQFFATLQSIHGEINHIQYLAAGDGVIGVGQVTYYRQLKGYEPDQRIVVWTDFRHRENGKWVYVFRHAHLVNSSYVDNKQSSKSPNTEHR